MTDRLRAVADVAMRWNYRIWGFGEAIALRGLLRAGDVLGDAAPFGFVHGILRSWLGRGVACSNEDHVGAGRELVALYDRTGDARFLDAARRLGALNESFPKGPLGARYHRGDTPGWRWQIWSTAWTSTDRSSPRWRKRPARTTTSTKQPTSCWDMRGRCRTTADCCSTASSATAGRTGNCGRVATAGR